MTRRQTLLSGLFGAGYVGLRSLATGLPIPFLLRPERASAEGLCSISAPQYLIFSTSSAGDPVNANVPGTYDFAEIAHSAAPEMAKTPITLGGKTYQAARPWSALPQWVLDRTCFFHHATLTNNHPNLPKVLRAMGQTARQEMLPSIYAKALAPCLMTIQREPVVVGAGEVLTFEGRGLPNLDPTGLRDVLTKPTGPLANLQAMRDRSLDEIHAILKQRGNSAQRAYLDRVVRSRAEARSISDQLLDNLSSITSNQADGQVVAAATLIKMNIAPVVAIRIPFGGDNHRDVDLANETEETVSGVGHIAALMTKLKEYGLEDRVSFAMYNVFGRTLKKLGTNGRDHWASHHTTVMIGKGIRAGVVGGLTPGGGDFYAQPIHSQTGRGDPAGDIPFEETLSSVGKTLGAALGLPADLLDQNIGSGKVVRAAIG